MSQARLAGAWRAVVGVEKTVVEGVAFDEDVQAVVVSVRPVARARGRCGLCLRPCPGYDRGRGRRRWRHVDAGLTRLWLEADAPRVRCRVHGVVVAHVPWARHGAGQTRAFEDTVAWLVTTSSSSAVSGLLQVAWRTVGAIISRVGDEARAARDPLEGLRRIGIDEVSYRRGHKYLVVVVDHDTKRLVWAGPGREKATLKRFFDALGEERCALIEQVSADMAPWIADMVFFRAPNAIQCADPFHLVQWCTDALDAVRRQVWQEVRRDSSAQTRRTAPKVKGSRGALLKNPETLTGRQRAKLAWIAASHKPLWRAWELKEAFRKVIKVKGAHGAHLLDDWLSWATRSRLPAFVELARRIRRNRHLIENMLACGLSNGLVESTNTKIRLLIRVAFGFHRTDALINLAMLTLGGYRPSLPSRAPRPA